jgi:hypothetical protein
MAQLGDRNGAKRLLLSIKKTPEVASEALRALEKLEEQ